MNSRRRADIQRKLSLGAVPRPPDGLAERIKADIPNYLEPEAKVTGGWTPFGASMRIAAMLVMLATTAFITLRLLEPEAAREAVRASAQRTPVPAVMPLGDGREMTTASTAADEVRLEITESVPLMPRRSIVASTATAPAPAAAEPAADFAPQPPPPPPPAAAPLEAGAEAEQSVAGNLAAVRAEEAAAERDSITVTAQAPALAQPATAAATMVESAPASKRAAGSPAPQSAFARDAFAADLHLAPAKSLFGVSTDPEAFRRIETMINAGERPAASAVDVEGVLNYFAGPPAKAPRSGVRLEVEGSPVPVPMPNREAILRLTIDTATSDVSERRSTPPIAKEAQVEIILNRDAVSDWSRFGGTTKLDGQATLLRNASVTAVFQLDLKPAVMPSQRIATVRLHYRDVIDGKMHTIEKTIRKRDLDRRWDDATRRHRLAVLGAQWAETLKGSEGADDVALRAEELARQNPSDARARELAEAAVASRRGGGNSGAGRM